MDAFRIIAFECYENNEIKWFIQRSFENKTLQTIHVFNLNVFIHWKWTEEQRFFFYFEIHQNYAWAYLVASKHNENTILSLALCE